MIGASGGWLRFALALLLGVAALCSAGLAGRELVHSPQPWSAVGCLDSSCSYGMPMTSHMPGTSGTMGSGSALGRDSNR
jgi:hypothetical protein